MADAVVDKTEMIINVSGSDVNFAASGETVRICFSVRWTV